MPTKIEGIDGSRVRSRDASLGQFKSKCILCRNFQVMHSVKCICKYASLNACMLLESIVSDLKDSISTSLETGMILVILKIKGKVAVHTTQLII